MFKKPTHFREFFPPILIAPLNKVRHAFMSSAAKKTKAVKIAKFEADRVKPYSCSTLRSYSQFNEDLLIDLLFLIKDKGYYVDVGANDPIFNSNTKRFYDKGWCGINIEPGIEQFEKFRSSRRRDINLNVGVGSIKGKMVFYRVVGDSTLSSFNKNVAMKMAEKYELKVAEEEVDVLRLIDICDEYVKGHQVDFMSVDAEGFDLDVLKSNDWSRFRPSLVMVEVDSQYKEIIEYMASHNYLHIFNNFHNAIFLDRDTSESNLKAIVGDDHAS
jgi:FkbM family methyltransferase